MQHFFSKYEKYASRFFFMLLIISMVPMSLLGFYNHPLGDDFYFGYSAIKTWQETGNLLAVIEAAINGTFYQYTAWQGTYSAMFFMHLPPQIWGDFFYKLYPTILFLCFTVSVFYCFHAIFVIKFKTTKDFWVLLSSLYTLVCIQQVPLCGESFYWYNGSMYYTGFLAVTFFFWGSVIKLIEHTTPLRTFYLSLLALFIAGGNYISLLPTLILLGLLILYYFATLRKGKSNKGLILSLLIIAACLVVGFTISAIAPGNAVRKATALQQTPIQAILKSIYQNSRYMFYWSGIGAFLMLLFATPACISFVKKTAFSFKYSFIICGLIFGIYCSTSCPPIYAQSNGGAARVFCLVYFLMILCVLFMYLYFLGALIKRWENNGISTSSHTFLKRICIMEIVLAIVFSFITVISCKNNEYHLPNSLIAAKAIITGEASYYEDQYQQRITLLNDDTIEDVVFSPYDVPSSLNLFLYVGDISTDPNNLSNRLLADIYEKNSIKIVY